MLLMDYKERWKGNFREKAVLTNYDVSVGDPKLNFLLYFTPRNCWASIVGHVGHQGDSVS